MKMKDNNLKILGAAALVSLASLLLSPFAARAAEPDAANPAKVDADYPIQGEYSGTLDGQKAGLQIVALGNGNFDGIMYPGGLPGDGWSGDRSLLRKAPGKRNDDGTATFTEGSATGVVKDGSITFTDGGNIRGRMERVVRESPTLGAKAPEGAAVLFDGSGLDAWQDGARLSEDKLLMEGANSKEAFGNFSAHIEFRLPYQPSARGQGRGNSGFYAQSRYEVQMLDSFGLEGRHNECGGIYTVAPPSVNMCFPPLQWQTYDVDFTAAEFDADGKKTKNALLTVRHNGVLIHKDLEVPHSTAAAPLPETPSPGPLHFQNHGNPVRYRNIWVVRKD